MQEKQGTIAVPGDDEKEKIAGADLSRFVDLVADLIAEERIKKLNMIDTAEPEDPPLEF